MLNVSEVGGTAITSDLLHEDKKSVNECFDAILSMLILGTLNRDGGVVLPGDGNAEKPIATSDGTALSDTAISEKATSAGCRATLQCFKAMDKEIAASSNGTCNKPHGSVNAQTQKTIQSFGFPEYINSKEQKPFIEGEGVIRGPDAVAYNAIRRKPLAEPIELFGNYKCNAPPVELNPIPVKEQSFSGLREVTHNDSRVLEANIVKAATSWSSEPAVRNENQSAFSLEEKTEMTLWQSYPKEMQIATSDKDNDAIKIQRQPLIIQRADNAHDLKATVAPPTHEPHLPRNILSATRLDESEGKSVEPSCLPVFGYCASDIEAKLETVKIPVVDKIVNEFKLISKTNNNSVQISLEPESLGRLTLKVVSDKNGVHAKIITESLHVINEVNRGGAELTDRLNELGIKFNGIEASLKPGGDMMSFREGLSQERHANHSFAFFNGSKRFNTQDEPQDEPSIFTGRVYQGSKFEYLA